MTLSFPDLNNTTFGNSKNNDYWVQAPSIPSINYKPSAHCAYSMLVNKIKDKKTNNNEQVPTHLSKLKQALERFRDDKKSEDGSGNER